MEKLDPEGHGKISFEEFYHGVHDFLGKFSEFNLRQIVDREGNIYLKV